MIKLCIPLFSKLWINFQNCLLIAWKYLFFSQTAHNCPFKNAEQSPSTDFTFFHAATQGQFLVIMLTTCPILTFRSQATDRPPSQTMSLSNWPKSFPMTNTHISLAHKLLWSIQKVISTPWKGTGFRLTTPGQPLGPLIATNPRVRSGWSLQITSGFALRLPSHQSGTLC